MQTYMHPYLWKQVEDQRRLEAEQHATNRRLLRQAGRRQRWVARKGCWLIYQVGRALIWSGHWLQEVGALRSG